jgi:hypothetical protein
VEREYGPSLPSSGPVPAAPVAAGTGQAARSVGRLRLDDPAGAVNLMLPALDVEPDRHRSTTWGP